MIIESISLLWFARRFSTFTILFAAMRPGEASLFFLLPSPEPRNPRLIPLYILATPIVDNIVTYLSSKWTASNNCRCLCRCPFPSAVSFSLGELSSQLSSYLGIYRAAQRAINDPLTSQANRIIIFPSSIFALTLTIASFVTSSLAWYLNRSLR